MATAKEKCFRKALDKINDGREAKGKRKLDVAHEQGWIRDKVRGWEPAQWYQGIWNSIKKTWDITRELRDPEPGRLNSPEQFRKPDVTLTKPDGSKVVIDTKFTDGKGKVDDWRETTGQGGKTQQQDYEDINEKQGNDVGEPSLDKNSCECGKRKLETERVVVRVPSYQPGSQLYFAPLPGPGGITVPEFAPGGFAIPEFVFP